MSPNLAMPRSYSTTSQASRQDVLRSQELPGLPLAWKTLLRTIFGPGYGSSPMLKMPQTEVGVRLGNTADGQAFKVDVFVALKPNPAVLDVLHSKVGIRYMETVVVPLVRSKVRDVSAGFGSEAYYIKAKRGLMEGQMKKVMNQDMAKTNLNGQAVPLVLIEGIFLGTPQFPEGLKDSLEQKQVASITAQTAGVKAQIQEKETTRRLILSQANQKAIELQGQAAAKNAQLADLLFYERLQDRITAAKEAGKESPLNVIRVEGDKSTIFLNVESQKMKAAAQQP
jgi:prohibitin 2